MRRWIGRAGRRLLLATLRPYRDSERRRIKAIRALEQLQDAHAALEMRHRALLEEISRPKTPAP